jgi:hypothetical protein
LAHWSLQVPSGDVIIINPESLFTAKVQLDKKKSFTTFLARARILKRSRNDPENLPSQIIPLNPQSSRGSSVVTL